MEGCMELATEIGGARVRMVATPQEAAAYVVELGRLANGDGGEEMTMPAGSWVIRTLPAPGNAVELVAPEPEPEPEPEPPTPTPPTPPLPLGNGHTPAAIEFGMPSSIAAVLAETGCDLSALGKVRQFPVGAGYRVTIDLTADTAVTLYEVITAAIATPGTGHRVPGIYKVKRDLALMLDKEFGVAT